jgi:tetratricopeptide (TPR) repeat protein
MMLAGIFLSEGGFKRAMEAVDAVLAVSPQNPVATLLKGRIYMQENRLEEANACFQALLETLPQSPEGFFYLGLIAQQQKKYAEAAKNFESALSQRPGDMTIFVGLVSALIKDDRIDAAIAECEARLEKSVDNPRAQAILYDLKGRLFLTKNDLNQAEKDFKAAIIANPNHLPPYASLANIYLSTDQADAAIARYRSAIEKEGRQEMPHMMLGIIFATQKQWELAELHYRRALSINPEFAPAANNLAYLLAQQGKEVNEALRLAEKARQLVPDDPRVLDTLGWVYVGLGFYDQAIRAFTKSIEQMPENATLHYHLGVAYDKKGAKQQAKASLERALGLKDDFPEADQARKLLLETNPAAGSDQR